MLVIDNNQLQKFQTMKELFLSKTKVPIKDNWKEMTNNEIWLAIVAQVMVVGRSSPYEKFIKRRDLQNKISYQSLLKITDETELAKTINHVLLVVGTRYASKELSKSIKTKSLVHNLNEFRKYDNGTIGFLNKLTKFQTDKERINYIMKTLKYVKTKGARDFLMELGIIEDALALDVRVQNILQSMGIKLPKNFTSNPTQYARIEEEILKKLCKPLGITGVIFDRMLYQNYEGCLTIARSH